MMKSSFLQFFLLGLVLLNSASCNSKNDTAKPPTADRSSQKPVSEKPKILQAETKKTDNFAEIFQSLPKEWIMLTKENEKYIIYIPCDYQNQSIVLNKNGKYTLQHAIGQDAYYFEIRDIKKQGNRYTFELYEENAEKRNIQYTLEIKDNNQATWGVYDGERKITNILTTDARFESRYKTVEEPPCLE